MTNPSIELGLRRSTLYIGPDAVHATPCQPGLVGLSATEGQTSAHPLTAGVGIDALEPALHQALDALGPAGRRIEVVLSDAQCRYLSIPRAAGLRHAGELIQAMRARFESVYDNGDGAWTLAHHAAPAGKVDLTVGARADVLSVLQRVAASRGVAIGAAQPHWIRWHDTWRKALRRGSHWLLSGDGHWAGIGYVADGRCVFARSMRLHGKGDSLQGILSRHQTLVEDAAPDAEVWVCGDGIDVGDAASSMGGRFHAGRHRWGRA